MSKGDATYIKALNRRNLIEKIIEHCAISRIELSRLTGLNRSTVSTQINQLMQEGLIIEGPSEISKGGRKPILLQMNEDAGFTIGIDIDMPTTQIQVTNLLGKPVQTYRYTHDKDTIDESTSGMIQFIEEIITEVKKKLSPVGLVGIGIGIHGIVDNDHDIVYTPTLQRIQMSLKEEMEHAFGVPIYIDNNANLSVYAEQVLNFPIEDLFTITMYSGIGLGIIEDNSIYRGFQGFAGEIGHMIVERGGLECPCGNNGCWELYASERALVKNLESKGIDGSELEHADANELLTHYPEIIHDYLDYFAVGLNNIINIFNPETLIINSPFLRKRQELLDQLRERLNSRMNNYDKLVISALGKNACSLGGAMIALKNYYEIKTLNLNGYRYFEEQLVEN
ncbi:ROK family transcriptional regulator [Halobacillus rhizosphaerae]|uniref:ROK family protein n=1 Tax=Halobacillus rhizosphaerae TaxID=3064889 RepID=UPI00398A5A7F